MTVPSHVGSNTQDSSGAQSLTFTVPAATTTDDFIVVFVKQSENTGQQLWDDDGGGTNGYTLEIQNRTTSGRDMECAIYWKFATSGSEANPTFTWDSGGTNEPMSGIMEVYRGVDQVTPFQGPTYSFQQNTPAPTPPDVTINFIDTRVLTLQGVTHDDISTVAAPTGFTLRSQVWNGTADDHRNVFSADIEIDTIGNYSPPDWQHSTLNSTPESQVYTLAINEAQPLHVTGGTALDQFNWGDENLTVTGDGFEATQGTGTVEYWDDVSGTTQVAQTIDSWSDTSIQIDTSQGGLPNDTTIYLVVTNDTGDESGPIAVNVGVLPYSDAVLSLSPDHYWRLNNVYDDTGITGPTRNMTSGVVGTWSFNTQEIVDNNTHSLNMNAVTDRREITDSPNMNITINSDERTVSTWFQINDVQHPLAAIWKEGGGVQNLALLIGYGNVVLWQMADVAGTRDSAQVWSSIRLTPGRPYHLCGRYTDTECSFYLDGVKQLDSEGNPLTIGTFDSHSGDVTWNDPDNNLETGGTDIAYNGLGDAQLSDFATWSDNSANAGALNETTEIRDVLFRRGAIPDDTISTGTESSMQTSLDGTADVRPDWPLSYRIEPVSGGGNFELVMTDKQFDSRITEHLEYRGSDTLTIVRPSSSNFDENKAFTTAGGTITVVDEVDLTITARDISSNAVIQDARVRMTADTGGPETVGTVLLEGVTNVSGQLTGTYRFSTNQPVDGRVRKSTSAPLYKTSGIAGTITSNGLDLTVFMISDE